MSFLLPAALLVTTGLASFGMGLNLAIPMVLLCASWAAWDAHRIGARHFRHVLGRGPVSVFFLVTVFWIIAFPAYLELRERIRGGMIEGRPGLSTDDLRRLVLAAHTR